MGEKQKPLCKVKIVVDTNIIFSALLNPNGRISEILLNSFDIFAFSSPSFLISELEHHKEKLLKLSGYQQGELEFLQRILFRKVDFLDVEFIQESTWLEAIKLTEDIDEFDAPFIALALELKCHLWTGDKKLSKGLKAKGFDFVLNTEEMNKLRDE